MRRVALGFALVLFVAVPPALSQVVLLFPYGVAAGDVTSTSAVLWTRSNRSLPVAVEVSPDRGFGAVAFTAAATPSADRGGSVKLLAGRLNSSTQYFFRFKVGRGAYSDVGTFVTAPAQAASADLRLAFSGDVDGTHVGGAPVFSLSLLDSAAAERPDVFILLGDTIYSDSAHGPQAARTLEEYRAKYRELQATSSMRALLRSTSVIVMWDDHEVENDFDAESVEPTGMKEVVVGPIATNTFARAIATVAGQAIVPVFAASFLQAPLPQGLGLSCAVLDRFTYATIEVSSAARTVTITPKDAAGQPVCRNPLVLNAVR